MQRGLGALVLLAATPSLVAAGEVRTQFAVTAYVPPRASIQAISEPAQISISEQDLARGYVDVAAVYRVSNNDPAGYVLRLAPRTGLTSSVEVSGLASRVVMRDDIVDVSQPSALRPQQLNVSFRLMLDPAAVPGTYALPVHVAVFAL